MAGRAFALLAGAFVAAASAEPPAAPKAGLDAIEHIVVIYAENRSFDHFYGLFPGADGIANATPEQYTQVDHDGKPLPHLPPVWKGRLADPGIPEATCRTGRSASTRRRSTCRLPRRRATSSTSSTRTRSRSTADATIASPRSRMPAASRWATTTARSCRCGSGRRNTRSPTGSSWRRSANSYLNHFWLICACTPRDPNRAGGPARAARRSGLAQAAARVAAVGAARRPPRSARQVHAGRLLGVDHCSRPTSRRACRRRTGGDPRFADPSKRRAAAADAEDDRRHAVRQGRLVGVVRGRLERGASRTACSRPAAKRRVIYNDEPGRAVLRHAPPAVQLLRALRAGHRRPRAASQGLHRSRRRHREGRAAGGRVLQAAGHAQRASRLRRRAVGRPPHRGARRKDQGEPALGTHGDHRHLRREWRLLGPRARRRRAIAGAPARAFRRSSSRRSPGAATSTTRATTRRRSSNSSRARFGLEPLPGVRAGAGDLTAAFDFK